jgi:4-hydroxy-4-methyl-2-oxoglutarate aldolase
MTDLTERLGRVYTGAVHDVLRSMGVEDCVLPPGIKPLKDGQVLAGEIWTVGGHIDRSADAHETLLGWTGLLSKAPSDKVIICQPNTYEIALMGELSAETLKLKGVRGYIVDGGCRDVDFILKMDFPVYCRFTTPADIVGRWLPAQFGQPITIGRVTISTGDYVLADRDGVVVLPRDKAAAAITQTEEVIRTENKVRTAILGGMDPQEAYKTYGKF